MYLKGDIKPVLHPKIYALEELPIGLKALASRNTTGKVVVCPNRKTAKL